MKKALQYTLQIVIMPVDILYAMLWALIAAMAIVVSKKKVHTGISAVFITPTRGGIESIYRKFGTLDVFLGDNPGSFAMAYRFLLGKQNIRLKLNDHYVLVERKVLKQFPFSGTSHMLASIMWVIAKQSRMTIVHAKDPYYAGLIGLVASRLSGCPFCVSIHADYDESNRRGGDQFTIFGSIRLAAVIARYVMRQARLVGSINATTTDYILSNSIEKEKIRPFEHGIIISCRETDVMEILTKYQQIVSAKRKVLYVGRLSKDKLVGDVVNVALEVLFGRNDVQFIFAGDGEEKTSILKDVKEAGVSDRVAVLGHVNNEDVSRLMILSDVVLCPWSGFVLVEAAMCGAAIVAYDYPGHLHLVKDGDTGILVPRRDVNAMAFAAMRLLDDESLRLTLKANMKKHAMNTCSLEQANSNKIKFYKEVVERDALRNKRSHKNEISHQTT